MTAAIPPRVKELAAHQRADTELVSVGPFNLYVDPEVYFHTRSAVTQAFLANARFPGKDVLDMGCGTGAGGILALHRGARSVTFSDVSEKAIANTTRNLRFHELESHATVVESDLFSALSGKKFDVITFNFPFSYTEGSPEEVTDALGAPWGVARNYLDPGYKLIDQFMEEFARYLRPGGFAQVSFGTTGNVPLWHELIQKHQLELQTIHAAPGIEPTDTNTWYIYRLIPPSAKSKSKAKPTPKVKAKSSKSKAKPTPTAKPTPKATSKSKSKPTPKAKSKSKSK